ncbi:type II MIKC* MADS-domain transcription factor [Selaginella moellendorffii]|uniref:Type II MIKC* MADS-domain transcription factor n=1 Tax=Selaginella moellendorffii TaxID=88036 RepID=D8RHR3_SELML|nr:type II MIKC* MADS-domain transcription factor [Selaginella moellendorffii]
MGRVKLEIKRIENSVSRHATFAKRKIGLVKKAQELATLCDIDIALIMFSPVDHLIHYPSDLKIQEIIMRYANVPLAERIKRKKENLEQLNRGIRKQKGDNEIARGMGFEDIEVLQKELARLQQENQILQNHLRLFQGDCASLDSLNYEELHQMELHIQTVMEKASLLKGRTTSSFIYGRSLESYDFLSNNVSSRLCFDIETLNLLLWFKFNRLISTVAF